MQEAVELSISVDCVLQVPLRGKRVLFAVVSGLDLKNVGRQSINDIPPTVLSNAGWDGFLGRGLG